MSLRAESARLNAPADSSLAVPQARREISPRSSRSSTVSSPRCRLEGRGRTEEVVTKIAVQASLLCCTRSSLSVNSWLAQSTRSKRALALFHSRSLVAFASNRPAQRQDGILSCTSSLSAAHRLSSRLVACRNTRTDPRRVARRLGALGEAAGEDQLQ